MAHISQPCLQTSTISLLLPQIFLTNVCLVTEVSDSEPRTTESGNLPSAGEIGPDSYVGMRMRGLPFQATEDDINVFFADYKLASDSIKFGMSADGRKSGEGACLFENETDCKAAFNEKQGQNIGHRWIELY